MSATKKAMMAYWHGGDTRAAYAASCAAVLAANAAICQDAEPDYDSWIAIRATLEAALLFGGEHVEIARAAAIVASIAYHNGRNVAAAIDVALR